MQNKNIQRSSSINAIVHSLANAQTSIKNLFSSVSVTTVSSSSTVTFTVALNENLATSGQILINVPSPGSFTPSSTTSKCTTSTTNLVISSCVISANSVLIGFTISGGVTTISTPVIRVQNFINPFSTTSITGITVTYYDSTGTTKETSTGFTLTGFTASVMTTTPTLTSSSDLIGATGMTMTVTFKTVGVLLATGKVQLVFPTYTSSANFVMSTSPSCKGILVLKSSGMSCTFDTTSKTLTLTSILSSDQAAGVSMSFSVDNIRNPYNGVPKTGFTLYTLDSAGGYIDYSTAASFTVSTFSAFTNPAMQRNDGVTTVDEYSILQPYFELPLPIDATCRFRIDFPSDMPITSTLSSVQGVGLFSASTSFYSIFYGTSYNYLEVNGCSYTSTQDSADVGLLTLSSVANKGYVYQTNTWIFTLYAMVGATYYNIAQSTTSLILSDFTAGTITNLLVTPVTTYNVQSSTTFKVVLTPAHDIQSSSKIIITFPSTITFTGSTCSIVSGSTIGTFSSSAACTVSSQTLTITNPFGSSSYSATSGSFTFQFSTIGTNPSSSTATIGAFTVSTYAIVGTASYYIDTGTFSNLYTAVATQMTGSVSLDSTIACASGVTYTLTITNSKYIPASGIVQVILPTQLFLTSTALTTCKVVTSAGTFTLSTSTQCVVASTSPVTINMSGIFSSQLSAGSFTIAMTGITNPTSLSTTDSFSVYTMDSSSNQIEYATTGMTVQMSSLSPLTSFLAAYSGSPITNGGTGNILVTVTVTCPLTTGSVLYFTLPTEVGVTSGTTSCAKNSGTGLTSVSCSPSSNAVAATLVISSTLATGSVFSFKVKSVTNPPTTCVTSAFSSISIYDSSGNEINAYSGTYPTLQTTTAATATASLSQSSTTLSVATDYTISYTNVNQLPVGSTFTVGYPSIITVPSSFTDCYVQVGASSYGMTCSKDSTLKLIYVSGSGINSAISAASIVQITLGLITNPTTQSTTSYTLTLNSFTSGGCSIDTVTTGMTIGYTCNDPCLTCISTSKSNCTSCNQNDANGYYYLYYGSCLTACPSGTYADSSNRCISCMSECKTCSSSTTCDTCNTLSTSSYRIFYGNDCIAACPTGYYTPTGTTSCSICSSTCLTCSTSASYCLTCDTSGSYPNFYSNTCLSACASGTIAISNVCQACTSPCLTCSTSITNCVTCIASYYLYGSTCVSSCPSTTVALTSTTPNSCATCGTNCKTCSATSTSTCLTCVTGTFLYGTTCISSCPTSTYQVGTTCFTCDTTCKTCSAGTSSDCLTCDTSATSSYPYYNSGTCVSSCPSGYLTSSNVCTKCTSPCLTCSTSITNCVTCIGSYYLYGSTCVSSCPSTTVALTSTTPNSCAQCGTNCKTCSATSTSTCLVCVTGTFLYGTTCISTCPTGTYQSGQTCLTCDSTCKTCDAGTNSDCLTCDTSATSSYPYYTSGGTCVSSCASGYISINNVCKACTSPCLTCSVKQTQCVTCISSYFLYTNTCLATCPTGTVAQTSTTPDQCTACPSYCSNCSATNATACTVCKTGYLLYNSACYAACPTGTYQPTSTSICSDCDSTCLSCNTTSSNCTTCNSSSSYPVLYSNTCIAKCPTGYLDISDKCYQCTSPCLTCSVSITNCVTCTSGYYLYQSTCVKKCPSGTTLSGSTCIGCTTSCATCNTNASQCLQCNSGYYLYNYNCYKICPGTTKADNTSQSCIASSSSSSTTSSSSSSVTSTTTSSSSSSSSVINTTNASNSSNTSNVTNASIADSTYLYFPVSTTQTILGGVALGSHFKDPTSLLHSNTLALWAPLEFIAYGGQAYMAYVQEVAKQTQADFVEKDNITFDDPQTTSTSSSNTSTVGILRRRRLDSNAATSVSANSGWPLVFYGTAASFIMLIVTNSVWGVVHFVLVRKDPGYIDHRTRHCCAPICIAICSCCCSFKIGKLHHSRFFGLNMFSMQYSNPHKAQNILNTLSIFNLVLTLLPIVFVDIYGLIMHKWGNQFYITVIETFFLALCTIAITVFEFKHSKIQPPKDYSKLMDSSSMGEDALMQKIDDEIRKRLGGQGLDDLLNRLKREKGLDEKVTLKGLGKSSSMIDLNRDLEEDDRRVNTEPLDPEKKKAYLSKPNPFPRKDDPEHPNNCYAELGRLPKKTIDPANRKVKVIQTGDRVMDGDEYDKEFDKKMRDLFGNDQRTNEKVYPTKVDDEDEGSTKKGNKKNKMRGRKDKYYEQVDNEDMNFAEDAQGRLLNEEGKDDDDDDQLDKIDEESHNEDDDEEEKAKILLQQQLDQKKLDEEKAKEDEEKAKQAEEKRKQDEEKAKQELEKQRLLKLEEEKELEKQRQLKLEEEKEKERLKLLEEQKQKEQQELLQKQQEEQVILDNKEDEEVQESNGKDGGMDEMNFEAVDAGEGDGAGFLEGENSQDQIKDHPQEQQEIIKEENEEQKQQVEQQQLEEKIIKDENKNDKKEKEKSFDDIYNPKLNTTNDIEKQVIDEMKKKKTNDDMSDTDSCCSDDVNDSRYRKMNSQDLRKFNVHDILGDFDRDEKGNLIMLQNQKGDLVDKQGKRVNEKGYLIDEKTGDIVEKEKGQKIFDNKDLDERGELPPPFNMERFNFNPHDVRGAFDRDPKTGDEIIGNKKNDKGQLIDNYGRRINEHGYLVDEQGNILDRNGRIRLHHKQLDSEGNIPLLFNYKGKKYDIKDVIGAFFKDRTGKIIISRDKDNNMVDKKGRRVNNKGYLLDKDGNVINSEGKIIFDYFALSKDNEIPKFFPFLKFNVDDIKGDYEMDPLGNPMLQKSKSGELLDNKGRRVNEKGYLIDDHGNIKNKRGFKVFGRTLIEDDGEIPKVFRTGLFRKDTVDSFSQLMDEIEDLEKMHEMGENAGYRKQLPQKKPKNGAADDENERIARRIEQIVEEDNDDDDQIMKELEELANIRDGEGGDAASEGGNTSVDSKMEDTPSNYNIANQRFMEQEQMRERVRQQMGRGGEIMADDDDDEMDGESEYMNLPGRKIKRRKKKPKKKKKAVPKEPEVDVRDLMMAKAYGGLSATQVDKIIQDRKRKEGNAQTQMRPPINKNASNSRLGSMQSRRVAQNRDDDNRSDWGGSNLNMIDGEGKIIGRGNKFGLTDNAISQTNRNREAGKSQAKRTGGGYLMEGVQKNNLMGSTQNSFRNHDSNKSIVPRQANNLGDKTENNRDRRLSNIANSVSGFYREQTLSEQSKINSTQQSIAAQLPGGLRKPRRDQQSMDDEEGKQLAGNNGDGYDPELDRIYGAAKGFGDISMMSDWEKDSNLSGQSGFTQLTGVNNNRKIRGLESIYLQRLEPANKGGKGKKKKMTQEDKAKFRVMHNQVHDDPQWHVDPNEPRDELDSVLSDNYRQMEKNFNHGYVKGSERKKQEVGDDGIRPNIFHGNFYQYKEKQEKQRQQSMLDFDK